MQALASLGHALQELEDYAGAIANYDRALALRPDFVEAHFNRGISLQALGRLEEAAQAYGQVLHYAPERQDAQERLAELRQIPGQHNTLAG